MWIQIILLAISNKENIAKIPIIIDDANNNKKQFMTMICQRQIQNFIFPESIF